MESIELSKWMPLISAVIAGLVAFFISINNNNANRSKSMNEWRREKSLDLVLDFKNHEKELEQKLFDAAIDIYKLDEGNTENIYFRLNQVIWEGQYINKMNGIKDKLDLFIPHGKRLEFDGVLNKYYSDIVNYFTDVAIGVFHHPERHQKLPEKPTLHPFFLKLLDSLL